MDLAIDFHTDHKNWRSRLNSYGDEISFFFKELNKVFDKNKQNLARMEFIDEYEEILDKNSKKIEDLLFRITLAEKSNSTKEIDKKLSKVHHQLHFDYLNFERSFIEMKKRFKRFASHND